MTQFANIVFLFTQVPILSAWKLFLLNFLQPKKKQPTSKGKYFSAIRSCFVFGINPTAFLSFCFQTRETTNSVLYVWRSYAYIIYIAFDIAISTCISYSSFLMSTGADVPLNFKQTNVLSCSVLCSCENFLCFVLDQIFILNSFVSFLSVNSGDYVQAVCDRNLAENISRVLYPNDNVSILFIILRIEFYSDWTTKYMDIDKKTIRYCILIWDQVCYHQVTRIIYLVFFSIFFMLICILNGYVVYNV